MLRGVPGVPLKRGGKRQMAYASFNVSTKAQFVSDSRRRASVVPSAPAPKTRVIKSAGAQRALSVTLGVQPTLKVSPKRHLGASGAPYGRRSVCRSAKPLPRTVTTVPPSATPPRGQTALMVRGAWYSKGACTQGSVPKSTPLSATCTVTTPGTAPPAAAGGLVHSAAVSFSTKSLAAATPKRQAARSCVSL